DIYVLESGIKHELAENASKHVRVAAWSLLTDGVFNTRPIEAASIVDTLTDKHGSQLLLAALDAKEVTPLPESSHAQLAWSRLISEVRSQPNDEHNPTRIRVIRELLGLKNEFSTWWEERLT